MTDTGIFQEHRRLSQEKIAAPEAWIQLSIWLQKKAKNGEDLLSIHEVMEKMAELAKITATMEMEKLRKRNDQILEIEKMKYVGIDKQLIERLRK